MAEGDVEAQALAAQDAEHADRVGEQRRLRDVGAASRSAGPGADVLEVEVEELGSLGVGVAHLRLGGAQVAAHADGL